MIFEWDEKKDNANLRKHKIGFAEARTIFEDEFSITFPDEFHSNEEERFITIGFSNHHRILLVVHTELAKNDGETVIRIISCRRATAAEREIYEKQE